jgi:hypothetical protein
MWAKPIGKLNEFDISAVKRLNSRALNKLYMPSLVAVGNVKVAVAPSTQYQYGARLWALRATSDCQARRRDRIEDSVLSSA